MLSLYWTLFGCHFIRQSDMDNIRILPLLLPLVCGALVEGFVHGAPPFGPGPNDHRGPPRDHPPHPEERMPLAEVLANKLANVFHPFAPNDPRREQRPMDRFHGGSYSYEDHHTEGSYTPWYGEGGDPMFGRPGYFGPGPIDPGFAMTGPFGNGFGMPPIQNVFNVGDPRNPNNERRPENNQGYDNQNYHDLDEQKHNNQVNNGPNDHTPAPIDHPVNEKDPKINNEKNPEETKPKTNQTPKEGLKQDQEKSDNKTGDIDAKKDYLLVDNNGNGVYLLHGNEPGNNNQPGNVIVPNNNQPGNVIYVPNNQGQNNPVYQVLNGQNPSSSNLQVVPNRQNVGLSNSGQTIVLPNNQNTGDILVYANGQLIKIPGTILNQVQNVPNGNNVQGMKVIMANGNSNTPLVQNPGSNVIYANLPNQGSNGQYQIIPNAQNNQGNNGQQYYILQPNGQNTVQGINTIPNNNLASNNQPQYVLQPANQNAAQGFNNNNNLGSNQPIYVLQPNQIPVQGNAVPNSNIPNNQLTYVVQPAVALSNGVNSVPSNLGVQGANMLNSNQLQPNNLNPVNTPSNIGIQGANMVTQPLIIPSNNVNPASLTPNSDAVNNNPNTNGVNVPNVQTPGNQPGNLPQPVTDIDKKPSNQEDNSNYLPIGVHPAVMVSGFKETPAEDEDKLKTNLDSKPEKESKKKDKKKKKDKDSSKEKDNSQEKSGKDKDSSKKNDKKKKR